MKPCGGQDLDIIHDARIGTTIATQPTQADKHGKKIAAVPNSVSSILFDNDLLKEFQTRPNSFDLTKLDNLACMSESSSKLFECESGFNPEGVDNKEEDYIVYLGTNKPPFPLLMATKDTVFTAKAEPLEFLDNNNLPTKLPSICNESSPSSPSVQEGLSLSFTGPMSIREMPSIGESLSPLGTYNSSSTRKYSCSKQCRLNK